MFISRYSFWETRRFFYSLFIITSVIYYLLPFTQSVFLSIFIVGTSSVIQSLVLVYMEHYLNKVVDSKIRAVFYLLTFLLFHYFQPFLCRSMELSWTDLILKWSLDTFGLSHYLDLLLYPSQWKKSKEELHLIKN